MPSAAASAAPAFGASLHAFLARDAEADQGADLGADSIASSLVEVAQVRDLDLAVDVLVHGQRVDHAHRVARAQLLQLGDDLAVELGLLEAEHEQLYGSNRHLTPLRVSLMTCARRAVGVIASSSPCVTGPP